jgi:hypothetical protein
LREIIFPIRLPRIGPIAGRSGKGGSEAKMAILTKEFPTEDDYEQWLAHAGADVRVISIKSREAPPTRSGLRGKHQMTVTYQGSADGIAAGRNVWLLALEFVAVLVVLYGVIGYAMRVREPQTPSQVPFRLNHP